MTEIAIRGVNLGKRYVIGERQRYLVLRDILARAATAPARWFRSSGRKAVGREHIWALRDVNFEIREGEVVGLIGRNGAGKTTLLKILARVTRPTVGYAEVRGNMGTLLEVGTGFHPELTGRENVFLSGAILGMSKSEILRKFDQMVDFAGVDKFIDTPLKHYSSGMQMRLAFSVAAHLEPEILLVDEVLAVGDLAFQKKCLGKMSDVAQGGRTIIFVSHQMNQIRRLCQRVIWVDQGRIREDGPAATVVAAYESAIAQNAFQPGKGQGQATHFASWEVAEPQSDLPQKLCELGPVRVNFVVEVAEPIRHGHHGIALFNAERQLMWAWACNDVRLEPGTHTFSYSFPMLPLRPGVYSWQVSLWNDGQLVEMWDCLPDMIIDTPNHQHHLDEWNGVLNVPCDFTIREEKAVPR